MRLASPMQLLVSRFMLPLLLLAQVFAGMSPGRVLCFADAGCSVVHATTLHDHSGHDDACSDHHGSDEHRHAGGGDNDAQMKPYPDCHCHFHVSFPEDAGSSRDRALTRFGDVRLMSPVLATLVGTSKNTGRITAVSCSMCSNWPRTWPASDQCRARDASRLLL